MTAYYVATTGNNQSSGSSTSPWRTINHAANYPQLEPGDEIIVKAGVYNKSISVDRDGSENKYITIRSEVPGGAEIRPPSGSWNAVSVNANYIVVDGFKIGGARGDGIEANNVHHIKILNNIVHDNDESGIQFNWSEFISVEGNTTYNNASSGWYSGISIYENRSITGDTTTTGFRTIIKDNVSYGNITQSGGHSDGNGIIIDDFHNSQTSGYANYTYPTLVENNLTYNNGGKGIQVFLSDYVTVKDNTAYHNNLDDQNTGTWRGELSNAQSSNNTWTDNIGVADPSANRDNTAVDNTSFGGYRNQNVTWSDNLTFNGTAGQASVRTDGGNAVPSAANGNLLGVNPKFVDPANNDFHLEPGSPAADIGYDYGSGATDPDPKPQPEPSANTPPVAHDDSGFGTQAGTILKIAASNLLANDTDADGDSLAVSSVGSVTHGTVALNSSGDVVFTPASGYTGSANFSYSVSDGRGGSDSATVLLSVSPEANAAPVITSGSSYSLNENSKAVGSVAATDAENDTIAFSKSGGADAALFVVDAKTGAISFGAAPDFENPGDADRNNVYELTVGVSDGSHAAVTKSLSITVKDVADTATPPPSASGSSFFASTAKPAQTETGDFADYELGMKFAPIVDGEITALRYYRGTADASDTDVRTMNFWTGDGTKLASGAISSAPGEEGWQVVTLSSPVHVSADNTYVVSYGTTQNYAELTVLLR